MKERSFFSITYFTFYRRIYIKSWQLQLLDRSIINTIFLTNKFVGVGLEFWKIGTENLIDILLYNIVKRNIQWVVVDSSNNSNRDNILYKKDKFNIKFFAKNFRENLEDLWNIHREISKVYNQSVEIITQLKQKIVQKFNKLEIENTLSFLNLFLIHQAEILSYQYNLIQYVLYFT